MHVTSPQIKLQLSILLQKINKGIVMVTFVPSFINCIDPDNATVSQVAGQSTVVNTLGPVELDIFIPHRPH